ncbi:MAG: 5-formyltetrahydrofolate cyclo-ligase [Chitinophagaceae bacterium]
MIKKEIRKNYRDKRYSLTVPEQAKLDDLLLISFQSAALPFISSLLSYWPIEENNEPNTHLFTGYLEFNNPGLKVAYPKADFSTNEMKAFATTKDTGFIKVKYNIHEPATGEEEISPGDIDMVLVPLLAFDEQGYRVGYGKGFYDKYLAGCRPGCIKAGFSYFPPVESIADKDEFDVPLDLCITPQTVYVF